MGNALLLIRDERLYRATHQTFEAYCKERWNMARSRAYQYLDAAKVVENVHDRGHPTPSSEFVARPLTRLPPEEQAPAWKEAVDTAPKGKVTAGHLHDYIHTARPPAPRLILPRP